MNTSPTPPTQPHRPSDKRGRYILIGLLLLVGAVGLYALLDPAKTPFPRCLIRTATGYSCPGCGLQRAFHALLHGHFSEAFAYNRALPFSLILLLLYGYVEVFPLRVPGLRRLLHHPLSLTLLTLLVLGWWVGRNIYGC
ncbi:DUF2752 domain-containing protein [Porphyromonas sp.]